MRAVIMCPIKSGKDVVSLMTDLFIIMIASSNISSTQITITHNTRPKGTENDL